MEEERKQKEVLLEEFKKNEAKLVGELRTKQAENKKVENAIRNLINEEIKAAKAKAEADKKAEAEEKKKLAEEAKKKTEALAKADAIKSMLRTNGFLYHYYSDSYNRPWFKKDWPKE